MGGEASRGGLGALLLAGGFALAVLLPSPSRATSVARAASPAGATSVAGGPASARVRVRWGYTHVILSRLVTLASRPGKKEQVLLYVRRPYLAVGNGGMVMSLMSDRALRVLMFWTREALRRGPLHVAAFRASGARLVREGDVVRWIFEDRTARITLRISPPLAGML